MLRFPPGLEPLKDLRPSLWVREALNVWPKGPFRVRDLVPDVFEAYARVLHPPRRPTDLQLSTGRWAARAAELGVRLGPDTRWEDLEGRGGDSWSLWPGELMGPEVGTLADLLVDHTSAGDACSFALWSGFGGGGTAPFYMAGGSPTQRLATWWARSEERRRN